MEIINNGELVLVTYICDECNRGQMTYTGQILNNDPPKYIHKCNNLECNKSESFDVTYPSQQFKTLYNKFIVRITFWNKDEKEQIVRYYEVDKINESILINNFKKDSKNFQDSNIKIMSIFKMTHKEFLDYSLKEYNNLFPSNIKIFTFKSPNEKYFDIEKVFNGLNHEKNYIRLMQNKGHKYIGERLKEYEHQKFM